MHLAVGLKEHSDVCFRVLSPNVLVLLSVYSIPVSFGFNVKLRTIFLCDYKIRCVGVGNGVGELVSLISQVIFKFCLKSFQTSEDFWFPTTFELVRVNYLVLLGQ